MRRRAAKIRKIIPDAKYNEIIVSRFVREELAYVVQFAAVIIFQILFSILGSIVGVFLIWKNKGDLKTVIPFGPYIALAAIIYLLVGQEIARWYLNLFMPWA